MQSPYGSNQLIGACKYTGTVGWRFEGPDAQQVQGAARVLVKQCIDQINFNGGWGQACRQLALRDGTIVKAIVLQHRHGWEPIVRVEVFAPQSTDEQTSRYYPLLEVGYLNVDDLNSPLKAWLVPDVDYANYLGLSGCPLVSESRFTPHTPLALPTLYYLNDDGTLGFNPTPKSFWLEDSHEVTPCATAKLDTIQARAIQYATGKMRLYQQAKLGSFVQEAEYGDCAFFGRAALVTPNAGIIRDSNCRYWVANIQDTADPPHVDFYLLTAPDELLNQVRAAVNADPRDFRKELEAETVALAYSTVAQTPTYSASIIDSDGQRWSRPGNVDGQPRADPLAHGWKFAWDTNKARIVLIHQLNRRNWANHFKTIADLRSLIYELSFNEELVETDTDQYARRFVPRITLIEQSNWHYSHDWLWWFSLVGARQTQHWSLSEAPLGDILYSPPYETPIYGYFVTQPNDPNDPMQVRNNTWADVRITRIVQSSGDPLIEGHPRGYALINGTPTFQDYIETQNNHIRFEVTFAGETLRLDSYGGTYTQQIKNINSGGGWVSYDDSPSPYKPAITYIFGYDPPAWVLIGPNETIAIPTATELGFCRPVSMGGDGRCPGRTDLGLLTKIRASIYQFSGSFDVYRTDASNPNSRVPFIGIPLTDAESVFIINHGGQRIQETRQSLRYTEDTWGARLDDIELPNPSVPQEQCDGCYTGVDGRMSLGISGPPFEQIYNVRRTVSDPITYAKYVIDTTVSCYGKSGRTDPLELVFSATNEGVTAPDTPVCPLESPATYLTTWKNMLDPIWRYGITITQGVGTAKKLHTYCNELALPSPEFTFAPSKIEWLRQTATTGGYPSVLADDDYTIPIGWA